MIDTHMHLLDPARYPYPDRTAGYRPGADELGSLQDLRAAMEANGIEKAVLVQPSVYGYDNSAILDAVKAFADRFRGIAVVPADPAEIGRIAQVPGIAGIRLNLIAGKGESIDAPQLEATLAAAAENGLAVEVLAPCSLLASLFPQFMGAKPPVIIDHLGAPEMRRGPDGHDFTRLLQLSRNPQIHVKLSSAFRYSREAAPWPSLAPFVTAIVANYPAEQILWGSDWPFINLCGHPKPQYRATLDWLHQVVSPEAVTIMRQSALRLFGFEDGGAMHG